MVRKVIQAAAAASRQAEQAGNVRTMIKRERERVWERELINKTFSKIRHTRVALVGREWQSSVEA